MAIANSPDIRVKAKLFRGLADPSRLSILEALRDGAKNVSEIVEITGLTQPNTSMHLACLWECGLVDRKRNGRFAFYSIQSERFSRVLEVADAVLDEVSCRVAECKRFRGVDE